MGLDDLRVGWGMELINILAAPKKPVSIHNMARLEGWRRRHTSSNPLFHLFHCCHLWHLCSILSIWSIVDPAGRFFWGFSLSPITVLQQSFQSTTINSFFHRHIVILSEHFVSRAWVIVCRPPPSPSLSSPFSPLLKGAPYMIQQGQFLDAIASPVSGSVSQWVIAIASTELVQICTQSLKISINADEKSFSHGPRRCPPE